MFEKIGVGIPEDAYRKLRSRWIGTSKLPAELKIHIILCGAVCEWLEELAQMQLIRCIERQNRLGEDSATEKASTSILPHLATDIGAILALCREGYDVQARSLVRNFIERMDLLICVMLDLDFATSYLAAQSLHDSRDFFYRYISGGKLAKKSRKVFRDKFPDADFIHQWLLVDWKASTNLMLAAAAHPNHRVSMMSLFPNLGRGPSDAVGLGGHPTNGSNLTIATLLTAGMPLHFLFASYPYDEVQQYLQEKNISTSSIQDHLAYQGLLLTFPLVDLWLSDLKSAAQEFPA